MTPWEKTLQNFRNGKYSSDPSTRAYWAAGEMVPVHEVEPYREFNRKTQEKYPGHFKNVKNYIEKHGIDDMGILMYNPDTHHVYAGEGNTRLAVAKELGFTHVPMRVYRRRGSPPDTGAGGTSPHGYVYNERDIHDFGGGNVVKHVPQDIRPSQIGFTPMRFEDVSENLEAIIREADELLIESQLLSSPVRRTDFSNAFSVSTMIEMVMEGSFDWTELERLYGQDFPPQTPKEKVGRHQDYHELARNHGYHPISTGGGDSFIFGHPDGHMLDINTTSGEWVHTPVNTERQEDAVWGGGFGDLQNHLHSFHREW